MSTATPTNTPNVKLTLKLKNSDTNNTTGSPHPQIQVVNSGTAPLNLDGIEVRYWINCDCTGQAIQAFVDYAGLMPAGTSLGTKVQISAVSLVKGNQTGYVSIKFSGSIILQPNQYVEVQARFNKSDWSNMTQSNDWSYGASQNWQVFQKITGYSNGSLIWGQEPPAASNTVVVASVMSYPNPANSTTGTTLQYTVAKASGVSAAGMEDPIYVPDLATKVYLSIYSAAGRLIWKETLEGVYYVATGEHNIKWDGKVAGGHDLGAGMYTFKVLLVEPNGSSQGFSRIIMLK